jgi:hypothetical protein
MEVLRPAVLYSVTKICFIEGTYSPDWPAENAANEILAMTLFGGIAVET